jgi:hypothetical protein
MKKSTLIAVMFFAAFSIFNLQAAEVAPITDAEKAEAIAILGADVDIPIPADIAAVISKNAEAAAVLQRMVEKVQEIKVSDRSVELFVDYMRKAKTLPASWVTLMQNMYLYDKLEKPYTLDAGAEAVMLKRAFQQLYVAYSKWDDHLQAEVKKQVFPMMDELNKAMKNAQK